MRVVRGSVEGVERDRALTTMLGDLAAKTGEPALRVWTPPKQVAFGRRDVLGDGYEHAREIAVEHGYEPVERSVGGSAVAYTGDTVAFAYAVPTTDARGGIDRRYRDTTDSLLRALRDTGAAVTVGEPDRSFCPGNNSIQGSGKIVGIAQRVWRKSALVGGCVIVHLRDSSEIADVLEPIYEELDVPFERGSVGSVAAAGGPSRIDPVVEAIERGFTSDSGQSVVSPSDLLETVREA